MDLQIILILAFLLGVPAIAGWIWYAKRNKDSVDVPHKWDA